MRAPLTQPRKSIISLNDDMISIVITARMAFEMSEDERVPELAKALAHPARTRIIRLLRSAPGCIGRDIVDVVGPAQSTASEHLRILKGAGIEAGEISGPQVCYALNPRALLS